MPYSTPSPYPSRKATSPYGRGRAITKRLVGIAVIAASALALLAPSSFALPPEGGSGGDGEPTPIGGTSACTATNSGPFTLTGLEVHESKGRLDTGKCVKAGQTVAITANPQAQIWSGVWFAGLNGPAGWESLGNSQMPMPKERAYSLLARTGTKYTYVGNGLTFAAPESGRLWLYINDDVVDNGDHHFVVDSVQRF